jgi:hypothetical protein
MVEIHVDGDRIRFEVRGLHKLWAFKRSIEVPREAVRAVRRVPPDATHGFWKGWRIPGTHLPGVIVAGTYYKDGERHFWDVSNAERALEIELEGTRYDRLFVEVADPEAALRTLHRDPG